MFLLFLIEYYYFMKIFSIYSFENIFFFRHFKFSYVTDTSKLRKNRIQELNRKRYNGIHPYIKIDMDYLYPNMYPHIHSLYLW